MSNLSESDPGAGCSTKCEPVTDVISEDGGVNGNDNNQQSAVFGVQNPNPMLNPVVLNALFKVCNLSDLFNFRLVSKEWYSVSLTRFRDEMTVVIPKNEGSYGLENWQIRKWNRLNVSANKPFKSFRITCAEIGDSSAMEFDDDWIKLFKHMDRFWGKFGRWIRKLELLSPQVHCANVFKKAISEETPSLEELHLMGIANLSGSDPVSCEEEESVTVQPNLKHLVVQSMASLPITWNLLFRLFPNIWNIEVTLTIEDSKSIQNLSRDLTEISNHLKTKMRPKFTLPYFLRELRDLAETNSFIELLQIPLIAPKDITLKFDNFTRRNEGMRLLLSTVFLQHGTTLETLRVNADCTTSPTDNFPPHPGPFTSLTTLDLKGNFCPNFHFLEHFPNLKELGMLGCDLKIFQNTDSAKMEKIHLNHLKNFQLNVEDENGFRIPESGMEMFVKLMPQVEVFEGKLSNSSLRILCRGWRQLQRLTIASVENFDSKLLLDDEGITGIVKGCEERMSNITDLKDLYYLQIPERENISDVSVYHGFLKMPQLRILSVELSEEASEDALKALIWQFRYPSTGWITRRRVDK